MLEDQKTDDLQMVQLLAVVLGGDDSGTPVDNSIIAKRLGWNLEVVAKLLNEAKERSLVWGQRSGDKPAPWFKELEITVQGRRLVRCTLRQGVALDRCLDPSPRGVHRWLVIPQIGKQVRAQRGK